MDSALNQTGGDFARVRADFDLPDRFPAAALTEADQAVSAGPRGSRVDATDVPFVTVDPPGAKDLDQAMHLARRDGGYRLHYAIADLGAFVDPGGAIDAVARTRGQTVYLPDGNVPLHPTALSEGAASLLPDQRRAAALWTIDLDHDGNPVGADVRRAWVRSVAQFDYETVHADIDAGRAHPSLALLPEVGALRRALAIKRGAVELQLPEQDIERDGDGWGLVLRPRTPVDAWNAELSLLTGMCAAQMMLRAGIGVLRTLPPADDGAVEWLRRSAEALGIEWPADASAAELLATLDPTDPAALALFMDATRLLRGAGYTVFDGELPEITTHAGIAAAYAHVTAPLRRLVDRFGIEICLAVSAGEPVPEWVREALPLLPGLMETSDSHAAKVDRACLDQVEAWVLGDRVGAEFDAVVLRAEATVAEIFIPEPPVLAKAAGEGQREGERVRVRLTATDPIRRRVAFERA
ncbi:exoribonuclease R [Actinokineospora baliensis]|uniref:RNB domain-containing ribonuclease n=1 Tax=Actinokineospora baliensis TaxID=547056 RepID=UPI00195DD280|nr:RNB domain-containing ribonuclease [Actinokineospora baliensis]MBM7772170.1 exoribonuclease R [Actinokineospora baliensis]